jgi:hypothetical protein
MFLTKLFEKNPSIGIYLLTLESIRLQMSMNLRKSVEELSDMDLANLRFAFNGLMEIRDSRG